MQTFFSLFVHVVDVVGCMHATIIVIIISSFSNGWDSISIIKFVSCEAFFAEQSSDKTISGLKTTTTHAHIGKIDQHHQSQAIRLLCHCNKTKVFFGIVVVVLWQNNINV